MRVLISTILIFFSFCGTSQTGFLPGYYVDNNGNIIECLIKNEDWKANPTKIEYQIAVNSPKQKIGIDEIREFGIHDISKYIRSKTKIDRSSNNLNKINWKKQPSFTTEMLFLKALVDGDADLYMYEEDNLIRYFYRLANNEFEQLVYKRYRTGNFQGMRENNQYKQQLINSLQCKNNEQSNLDKIRYAKSSLVKVFVNYNSCKGSVPDNFDSKVKRELFNLTLKGGISISSLDLDHELDKEVFTIYPNRTNITLGIEAELVLPFNNAKWSVIVDPSFTKYRATELNREKEITFDYSALDIPFGIRYNHFINNDRLYLTALYSVNVAINSAVNYRGAFTKGISPKFGPALSIGYRKDNRYVIELAFASRRNLFSHTPTWKAYYGRMSALVGYNLY